MEEALDLWEIPRSKEIYMFLGWEQWADAGSTSSGLPRYLARINQARQIGEIRDHGFYLFQIPGTHDLVRPAIRFQQGLPQGLQVPNNEFYYSGNSERGMVFFTGIEPHLNIESYVQILLNAAKKLKVTQMIGFGGVYGEVPYNKERTISSIYSNPKTKTKLDELAVNFSDYQGGASIGAYLCQRASEQDLDYVSFYAFVPTYDFSQVFQNSSNTLRIENDFMAWSAIMRRVNHMLNLHLDLSDLENKALKLQQLMDQKVEGLDRDAPQLGVRAYMERLADEFTENTFAPLGNVWEDELRRLLDKFDDEE